MERDQISDRQTSGYHSNDLNGSLFNKTTSSEGLNNNNRKEVSPVFVLGSGIWNKEKGPGRERTKSTPPRYNTGHMSPEKTVRSHHAKSWGPDRYLQMQIQQRIATDKGPIPEVSAANTPKELCQNRQCKPNEGEWIKVERHKKPIRNDNLKAPRGRGRGRGRGTPRN